MKQCIENPNEVDWVGYWRERLEGKKNKDWDKAAPGFFKRTRKEPVYTVFYSAFQFWGCRAFLFAAKTAILHRKPEFQMPTDSTEYS